MSGRQLDVEETLECARLCLGSEAKSSFEGNRCLGELACGFRKNHGAAQFPEFSPVISLGSLYAVEAASDGVAEPCFPLSQSPSLGCSVDVLPQGRDSSGEYVEAKARGHSPGALPGVTASLPLSTW